MNNGEGYKDRIKDDPRVARKYMNRKSRRHKAEITLVERAFSNIPTSNTVLDIPCGAGRITVLLARKGYRCTGAEIADAMIDIARSETGKVGLSCHVEKADIEDMVYPDRHFGAAICFRLFHHFPNQDVRTRVIKELCRVTDNYVALSYLSRFSPTSIKRGIRRAFGGKASRQNATSLSEVEKYFELNNFVLLKDYAQLPIIRSLHLAVFKRSAPEVAHHASRPS